MRIDENSTIYVNSGALASMLPSDKIPASKSGYVSFEQLRAKGVGVRYNGAQDTIEIKPDGG